MDFGFLIQNLTFIIHNFLIVVSPPDDTSGEQEALALLITLEIRSLPDPPT